MKHFKYLLFALFLLVPFSVNASDHIYSVDMKINLDVNGNAKVTETWDVKASSGSEWYKQLYNLQNVQVHDFSVSMDGNPLKYKSWNVDESLSEKKGYYGINYVSEGIELCFGKYDMKRHSFTMQYTLTNFVFNTSDSQVIYFTLLPNATVDRFEVDVSSFYSFPDNLDVWGYGYKGYAYVKDGKITMTNEDGLDEEYVVLLAKFPLNTFVTDNSYSDFSNFDSVLNQAKEGSYEHDYSDYGYNNSIDPDFVFFLIGLFICIVSAITGAFKATGAKYGYKDNKKIDKNNVPMFRDIPCNKDIYYANALISLNKFGYKESNILGAIILKWVKEDKIRFINQQKGIFNKDTSSIDLTADVTFDDENGYEAELFSLMRAASGDGILEAKELEKWCKKHYSKFLSLLNKLKDGEISKLKSQNHIYTRTSKAECKYKNVMDDTIYKDSTELYGLRKFLEEFSRMKEKETLEVKVWDEYLMFAYLFGIADKVAKQLKNLYPEYVQELQERGIDINTVYYINHLSSSSVSAATAARSAAESYSGGGGGFSSGGGGGGSFGGGGSMGGR